jgi:hypothetical protein
MGIVSKLKSKSNIHFLMRFTLKKLFVKSLTIYAFGAILLGCASTEPPRLVSSISSSNSKTLTEPALEILENNYFEITYAEASIGFDSGCNPFKSFSDELNQCSKLPDNVKQMALQHCKGKSKSAMFLGNSKSLLQMTVSKFSCK